MPRMEERDRKKGALAPIIVGGAVLGSLAGLVLFRLKRAPPPPPPTPGNAVLVASTAPGQPEIS